MLSALLVWSVLGINVPENRDKLGTNFWELCDCRSKRALFIGFCEEGENEAERAGFEPAVRCYSYADLANRCFRPLSHLSGPYKSTKNEPFAQEDNPNHFNSLVLG